MLDKMIQTVDELNAVAAHLRQSGGMEELKKLAKVWGVPYAQTEEYIKGTRYRFAEVPVAEKEFRSPFEKLREEMAVLDDKYFASVVAWHVIHLCEDDAELGKMVLKGHKSLQRCLDFILGKAYEIATEQAKQKGMDRVAANTGIALTQNEVFPWAEEYYRSDDAEAVKKKEKEEKEKIREEWERRESGVKTAVSSTKKSAGKAKKKADQAEKETSRKKKSNEGDRELEKEINEGDGETRKKSSRSENNTAGLRASSDARKGTSEMAGTRKTRKSETSGQLSLFDLAG